MFQIGWFEKERCVLVIKHREESLRQLDNVIEDVLSRQLTGEDDPRYGGFWTRGFHVEPRESGFMLGQMIAVYVTPDSRWYLSERLAGAMRALIVYMQRHQRPDGCFDLTPCNYASPPDTAFMINALLNGWWLLEKCDAPEADFLREPVYQIIDSASRGIAAGGFHSLGLKKDGTILHCGANDKGQCSF